MRIDTVKENLPMLFLPFKDTMGDAFTKICGDTKAFLGREEKNMVVTEGDVSHKAKKGLTDKLNRSLALPLNSPLTPLINFSIQIYELNQKADFGGNEQTNVDGSGKRGSFKNLGIQVAIPAASVKYVDEELAKVTNTPAEPVKA